MPGSKELSSKIYHDTGLYFHPEMGSNILKATVDEAIFDAALQPLMFAHKVHMRVDRGGHIPDGKVEVYLDSQNLTNLYTNLDAVTQALPAGFVNHPALAEEVKQLNATTGLNFSAESHNGVATGRQVAELDIAAYERLRPLIEKQGGLSISVSEGGDIPSGKVRVHIHNANMDRVYDNRDAIAKALNPQRRTELDHPAIQLAGRHITGVGGTVDEAPRAPAAVASAPAGPASKSPTV